VIHEDGVIEGDATCLVYELRTSVFRHVQRQPLAFFTRAQTGALVSRLNNDVNEAQRVVGLLLYRRSPC
jgi:ATP-binding cassette subfamily B protein